MTAYVGDPDYQHDAQPRAGVLLVNLGTPDAPTRKALRRYLKEFLSDPRVIEWPRPLWWLVLNGIILNIRPARSARLYQKVWTAQGSPLLVFSEQQKEALRAELTGRFSGPVEVALAMRYGNPSVAAGIEELRGKGVRRLVVLPLYPQYSATTTASTFDAVADVLKTWRWLPELRFVNHYADDDGYIEALAARIRAHWQAHGRGENLLFSFHGIPKRYLLNGDPYHCECHKTARLVAQSLELDKAAWKVCFQSRFGREEWLTPYTDDVLGELARQGTKAVDICCPGFAADCLETLDEIAGESRQVFIEAGGKRFSYIPALNDMPEHIQALADIVMRHAQGWPETAKDWDQASVARNAQSSLRHAREVGASR
ncbi:MAG: ferrochelatase [Gammaproteobacteria bacterium]|nr:ferrochelatase [Gammaproteobacteria bacterium]MBA3730808.1 ferrochelatase [Gammaproteobacteria bacterium]